MANEGKRTDIQIHAVCHGLIISSCNIECVVKKCVCFLVTILQAKEELLVL